MDNKNSKIFNVVVLLILIIFLSFLAKVFKIGFAKNAADASDSTPNIRLNGENVQICLQNVTGWTEQLLSLALKLNATPFGPEMEPIVKEMSTLGGTLLKGNDANNNGLFDEAIPGECGATITYDYAYFMADMFIYPGPDRFPSPEK